MARKNEKVKVTHNQILVWAIQHKEAELKEEKERLNRLEQVDAEPATKASLGDSLRKSIEQHNQVLEVLYQMFEFETGSPFC